MTQRRVVLINRAGAYVGPALARRLAAAGHDLVLHEAGEGQVEELVGLGATVEAVDSGAVPAEGPGSLRTAEGWLTLVRRAVGRFGRLDAAALFPPSGGIGFTRGPFLESDVQHLREMAGYLETTHHALRAVIPAMRTAGGQIVVFTSDAGVRPEAGWALYGAARAGQSFLVRAVALEHAAEGICINAIGSKNAVFAGFPGAPPDDVTDTTARPGSWSVPLEQETPLRRVGTMEELAAFATVLLDGTNRFQTAQYFSFSGGWSEL